jgi:hypothetical protein
MLSTFGYDTPGWLPRSRFGAMATGCRSNIPRPRGVSYRLAAPPETNYPAHCNRLSHNCSIRLTHGSQPYNGDNCIVISISRIDYIYSLPTMLRCSTCHNLYMPRSFRQHACIPIISNAATCHNFFMLKSFRQHACSCKVCSHRPENAARRDARERRTDKTRHQGPEGALLFLRATPQVQK